MPCRHCQSPGRTYARGLCWECKLNPAIRCRYPSQSRHGAWADGADPTSSWPECRVCGGKIAYGTHGRGVKRCDTCRMPANGRAERHARIRRYAQRVAEGKPLFEAA